MVVKRNAAAQVMPSDQAMAWLGGSVKTQIMVVMRAMTIFSGAMLAADAIRAKSVHSLPGFLGLNAPTTRSPSILPARPVKKAPVDRSRNQSGSFMDLLTDLSRLALWTAVDETKPLAQRL